ncbi:Riboflavin transporter 2 [Trichuris trichiura]|uniref:Riboflavin transporter n=1 Tax=Trichuris trichiura TaxID=36087 RepID=A0A077ZD89_TRITR|nr:Riboflavin transporter 2 [Trichuris trichiura]
MPGGKPWFKFYLLTVLFGSCGWMTVNSVWVELPLLVNSLPEGWAIPSYLSLLVQIAIVGPILFGLAKKYLSNNRFIQKPMSLISLIIAIDALTSLLLSFFWHKTSPAFDQSHSISLFVLFFIHAMIDCTSSVLYMPYMCNFHPSFTNAYFVGLGLSGLIPSVLSLGQGTGDIHCAFNNATNTSEKQPVEARFSVQLFFVLISFWLCLGLLAFLLLHYMPGAAAITHSTYRDSSDEESIEAQKQSCSLTKARMAKSEYYFMLIVTMVICGLVNGVLPSIQSFSSLPYGQTVFQLVIVLSNVANPVCSYLTFLISISSNRIICFFVGLIIIGSAYIIVLAAASPVALLGDNLGGPFLCVFSFVVVTGVCSYLRTVVADKIRNSNIESRMFYCGAVSQIGSFVGALVMFPLVNVYGVFNSVDPCTL